MERFLLFCALIGFCQCFPSDYFDQKRVTRSVIKVTTNLVENQLKSGTNITKKVLNDLKEKFEEFDALIKEADENIHVVQRDIAELTAANLKFTKEFINEYHVAKEEIRLVRGDLRKLAKKTVSKCKSINKLIDSWDEKENAFITQQFKLMRQLLEDSLKTLEDATERYETAISSINKATGQLKLFSEKVNKMTDVSTSEYEAWTEKARAAAYTGAGTAHVGLIVADIFGCLGLCSTIGGAVTWGVTVGTLESKIAEYTAALKSLERVGNRAKENILNFNTEMSSAKTILIEEIRLIGDWEVAAEVVQNNIDSFSIEDLKAITVFQQIFVNDVKVLQKAAEDYLEFTKFAANDEK